MENAKPLPQSQKTTQTQQAVHRKKLQKRGAPLVEQRKICYTVLHDAPSPSGKAGDFDSPIVGSTPAGATRKNPHRLLNLSKLCGFSFVLRFSVALYYAVLFRIKTAVK